MYVSIGFDMIPKVITGIENRAGQIFGNNVHLLRIFS